MKKSIVVIALALLVWSGITFSSFGQTNNIRLESRVDRLESEISRVRSQLTRLESQVSGSGRSLPVIPTEPNANLPNELSLEEQFDNLATLAIELKQTVRQLEARVTALEESVATP